MRSAADRRYHDSDIATDADGEPSDSGSVDLNSDVDGPDRILSWRFR